jgi:hypothetical protein
VAFFDEMTRQEKYAIPIGAFASNISAEAILNKDSILYHEGDGYDSGLMGYRKDFSQAVYGNCRLVEALATDGRSPLDIPYEIVRSWRADHWKVFGRAVMITLLDYLDSENWDLHSYALYRSIKQIEASCIDVYKLNNIESDYWSSDIFKRLDVAVDFVKEAVNLIGECKPIPSTLLRIKDRRRHDPNVYDQLAALMFEIMFDASAVKNPVDTCWSIQHNAVWSELFSMPRGKTWDIVQHKVRRLLYDEIRRLEDFPNYKSSRILGFCLNVMGVKIGKKNEFFERSQYALHKVVLSWTKRNYLKLRQIHPEVAESCLIGSISFDEHGSRIVKTYIKGLDIEPPKHYLELELQEKATGT